MILAVSLQCRVLAALMVCILTLAGCAADVRLRASAEAALQAGDYEEAIHDLEDGLKHDPQSAVLRAGLISVKSTATNRLVAQATAERGAGRFDEARHTLERVLALDPGNDRAFVMLTELAADYRQGEALLEAEQQAQRKRPDLALRIIEQALKENPHHAGLLALQRKLEAERRRTQVAAAQESLAEIRPISLDFKDASLRTVLDAVSRNSGLNFVIDKDIKSDARATLYLKNARVEDALDLLISTNQLAKKVLDSKTIVIYPNTAEKQKEYQEQVVRVFHLESADAKSAAAFLKSMLKVHDPFVDEKQNLLALRESQDTIQLAERLVSLFDAGEPEVLLDVEVLEVSATRMTELGVTPPSTFSLTALPSSGSSQLTLQDLKSLPASRVSVGIGGTSVTAIRQKGDFTTLANPKIRTRSKEKASVMIGDKIPVVTATTGVGGFVSDSVNYLDVGLKLNVEPTVYPNDEVAIKIALEVSSLGEAVKTNSGTLAYQIGTRNASTLLRLQDGETQMLAGLISKDDRTNVTGLPGLADLPIVGRLFSDQQDTANKMELVLAITPHVLRNIRRPEAQEAELWVGTEAAPKLRPYGGLRAMSLAAAREDANDVNRPAKNASISQDAAPSGQKPVPAPAPVSQIHLSAPAQAKVRDTVQVMVDVTSTVPLRGLPTEVSFDPSKLQFIDAKEADFFKRDGTATNFSQALDAAAGKVSAGVIRTPATGATGEGTALLLTFKAIGAGDTEVKLTRALPLTLGTMAPATVLPRPVSIRINP